MHTQKHARYFRRLAFLHDNLYAMETLHSARAVDRLYHTSAHDGSVIDFPRLKRPPSASPKNKEELSDARVAKELMAEKPKPFFLKGSHLVVYDGKMYNYGLNLPRDCLSATTMQRMGLEKYFKHDQSAHKEYGTGRYSAYKNSPLYMSPTATKLYLHPKIKNDKPTCTENIDNRESK